MIRRDSGFHFGLEAEFLLVEARSFHPLWHRQLSFDELNALLESIAIDDFDCEGLDLTPLHRKKMPFVIEGYQVPDSNLRPTGLLPKGIEIRSRCVTLSRIVSPHSRSFMSACRRYWSVQATGLSSC